MSQKLRIFDYYYSCYLNDNWSYYSACVCISNNVLLSSKHVNICVFP